MKIDILKIALSQYGITETKGIQNNPEVMKYFHETGRTWINDDETPWCDAFMDWCAMKSGYKFSPGLNAVGWLKEGIVVKPEEVAAIALIYPVITVLWRINPSTVYGHVGLYVRHNSSSVWMLGGNQGIGQVNITPYPLYRLLGYRRFSEGNE